MSAVVHLHSSERMPEIVDASVRLFIGPGLYLGRGVGWDAYRDLYALVYVREGLRIIRPDGVFVVIQTNAYMDGNFICRYQLLLDLLLPAGWRLIDERVWERKRACHFQVPFSHVLIFVPPNGTVKRRDLDRSDWFRGIWRYPQDNRGGSAMFPVEMGRMIVETCTESDDLVVDPFAGCGQLIAEASRLGRRAIGYEIDAARIPILEKNGCQVILPNQKLRTGSSAIR